jgi:hypothetical protein
MTELLRNFETRQSLPWMAARCVRTKACILGRDVLTGIRYLGHLIALEAVPTLISALPDKLLILAWIDQIGGVA